MLLVRAIGALAQGDRVAARRWLEESMTNHRPRLAHAVRAFLDFTPAAPGEAGTPGSPHATASYWADEQQTAAPFADGDDVLIYW